MNIQRDSPIPYTVVQSDTTIFEPPLFGLDVFVTGNVAIIGTVAGDQDEVHSIAQAESDAGTWTLTIELADGTRFTTAAIAFDANAATIEAAIDTASPAGIADGDIAATGGPISADAVVLTFSGTSVENTRHPVASVISSLTLTSNPVADPMVTETAIGGAIVKTFPTTANGGLYPTRWECRIRQILNTGTTIADASLIALK